MIQHTEHGTVIAEIEMPEWVWKHFNHNRRTIQSFLCDTMIAHNVQIGKDLETKLQEVKELTGKLIEAKKEKIELLELVE